jgi:2-keto-3-deoxy-L-rhamnonate aldolase RhmA
MMRNLTKDRLKAGKVAFGFQIRHSRSIDVVRMAARSNFHFIYIDLEHSTMSIEMAAQFCAACLGEGITSIVRVPGQSAETGARLLDSGAQGLIVPHVHTAEQARAAVCDYLLPPLGKRSEGGGILLGWPVATKAEMFGMINERTLLGVMAESAEAIENIEEIAAVEGVDMIVVGSNDLAADLGIPVDGEDPRLLAAYKKVLDAANRNGKAVRLGGIYSPQFLQRTIELGSRLVTVTGDTRLLVTGMRSALGDIQARAREIGAAID